MGMPHQLQTNIIYTRTDELRGLWEWRIAANLAPCEDSDELRGRNESCEPHRMGQCLIAAITWRPARTDELRVATSCARECSGAVYCGLVDTLEKLPHDVLFPEFFPGPFGTRRVQEWNRLREALLSVFLNQVTFKELCFKTAVREIVCPLRQRKRQKCLV